MNVLVIEDDNRVAQMVKKGLSDKGHYVVTAPEGRTGLETALAQQFDVFIIDRMLPFVDGLTIIDKIREANIKTPALILSAMNKVDDRVKGLRSGADDYLVKPFAFEELLARLELLADRQPVVMSTDGVLSTFDLELNLLSRVAKRNQTIIDLQDKEFHLLRYMLANKGKVLTRSMLLLHVWNYNFNPHTNIIDVHVSRLRKKIDGDSNKELIKTVRGQGYMLLSDDQ